VSAESIAALVIRLGLVLPFLPFSALDKILGFNHAVGQAQEVFRPRVLAVLVLLCGLCIEIFCSLGVLTGIADRLCALILAGYCAASAVLYKRFWTQGDFWSNADGKGRSLFWDFLKNLSLTAAFMMIVVGVQGHGLYSFLNAPFTTSQPYRSPP